MPTRATPAQPGRSDGRPQNKILASLPADDFARLQRHLRMLPVALKQTFHVAEEPIREVIFLNGGVASITTNMRDGTTVEIATVGHEGFLGVEAFLGNGIAVGHSRLQVPDTDAGYLPVAVFRAELERRGPFFDGVQRYSQALLKLMMQSAACFAVHPVRSAAADGC